MDPNSTALDLIQEVRVAVERNDYGTSVLACRTLLTELRELAQAQRRHTGGLDIMPLDRMPAAKLDRPRLVRRPVG